jgi:hypothetical protein
MAIYGPDENPPFRSDRRNWQHLNNRHVVLCLTSGIPWYAAWDLAFHGHSCRN